MGRAGRAGWAEGGGITRDGEPAGEWWGVGKRRARGVATKTQPTSMKGAMAKDAPSYAKASPNANKV